MLFEEKVSRYIHVGQLAAGTRGILVALSGGADSVALLHVLLRLGYACEAAHCNFRLRGEESERDETFVRKLCQEQGVKLHVRAFDTSGYARRQGISIEMAARQLRYDWFEELRRANDLQAVAVAHHREDNAETLLLNLVRGTGIKGLTGMASRNGYVVRPLLEVSRVEIESYLRHLQQAYVTDSTNLEDDYTRNKLRLNILPQLQTINPSVIDALTDTAARLGEVEAVYRRAVEEACRRVMPERGRISIEALLKEPSPSAVLFELLHPLGFNASQQADILRSVNGPTSGKRFYAAGWELLRDRDYLSFRAKGEAVPQPRLVCEERMRDEHFALSPDRHIAYIDADLIDEPLQLRKWKQGDSFVPFGMKGVKSVNHYLRDRKYSLFEKEGQYVVVSGERIVWLVDERIDNRFRLTDATRRIWVLRVLWEEDTTP